MPDADLSLAVPAVFFGSVGTAGQRCTSTRRLYLHRSIAPVFLEKLQALYAKVQPGDPLVSGTLLGPVHNHHAINVYSKAVETLRKSGAEILTGGARFTGLKDPLSGGNFVQPTISVPTSTDPKSKIWSTETFAPILNVAIFDELEQAIEWNNAVPQGLSSSLWTRDIRSVGKWIGPAGSDTGIVNVRSSRTWINDFLSYLNRLELDAQQVNVGTSGAEIGAAFGGNKVRFQVLRPSMQF